MPASRPARPLSLLLPAAVLVVAACAGGSTPEPSSAAGGTLTIYAGRSEELVGPLIEQFETESDVEVEVNYAGTSELAATILEEGDNSPADGFFAQDAGALGALAQEGRLAALPPDLLDLVESRFRSPDGLWVGVSGRARVAAYNTDTLSDADMPASILDFADPRWKGLLGWAPSNASLQAFVTALRVLEGDDAARAWLEGIQANEPKVYEGNSQALQGVASGEIQVAFVNHYYLMAAQADGTAQNVANHFFPGGDPGALVNVAGAGVLSTSDNAAAAEAFIAFLLAEEGQQYFADETFEYPLAAGVPANPALPALEEIESPEIDLSDLADLEGTLELMQEAGVL